MKEPTIHQSITDRYVSSGNSKKKFDGLCKDSRVLSGCSPPQAPKNGGFSAENGIFDILVFPCRTPPRGGGVGVGS